MLWRKVFSEALLAGLAILGLPSCLFAGQVMPGGRVYPHNHHSQPAASPIYSLDNPPVIRAKLISSPEPGFAGLTKASRSRIIPFHFDNHFPNSRARFYLIEDSYYYGRFHRGKVYQGQRAGSTVKP